MKTCTWFGGDRCFIGSIPLTSVESAAIERAKKDGNYQELMRVKHMAERFIEVEVSGSSSLFWLFYLPDFTRLFKDWYAEYIDQIFAVYRPQAKAWLTFDDNFLLLKYEGERPREVVNRLLEKSPYDGIKDLVIRTRAAEQRCSLLVNGASAPELSLLVSTMSHFAAYALDTVFPEKLFCKKFPTVELAHLYGSPISSWLLIEEIVQSVLEKMYIGRCSRKEAVRRIASGTSYLRWNDIEDEESDLRFAEYKLARAEIQFPNVKVLWENEEELKFQKRIHNSRTEQDDRYMAECRKHVAAEDLTLFDTLAMFAREGQRCNEMRRLLFTKTLRTLRDFCDKCGLDWRTVTLHKLLRCNENQSQPRKGGDYHDGYVDLQGSVG